MQKRNSMRFLEAKTIDERKKIYAKIGGLIKKTVK